jgi:hypothetical protein
LLDVALMFLRTNRECSYHDYSPEISVRIFSTHTCAIIVKINIIIPFWVPDVMIIAKVCEVGVVSIHVYKNITRSI